MSSLTYKDGYEAIQKHKYIKKAIEMAIEVNKTQVAISKTQLLEVVLEALKDESNKTLHKNVVTSVVEILLSAEDDTVIKRLLQPNLGKVLEASNSKALKNAIQPHLINKFPQLTGFNQAVLGGTNEDGSIEVTLKVKQERPVKKVEETTTDGQ